jgi:hypothetical protein
MGPDNAKRLLLLQVVNVIGPDHTVSDAESQNPFIRQPWLDMDITVPGSMLNG